VIPAGPRRRHRPLPRSTGRGAGRPPAVTRGLRRAVIAPQDLSLIAVILALGFLLLWMMGGHSSKNGVIFFIVTILKACGWLRQGGLDEWVCLW